MFASYFKIAWRNLWKNKSYTLINMVGLITGITCCLFIGLYILHEVSFDRFQQKGDRLVRVIMEYGYEGKTEKDNYTSTKVMPVFARTFPEVETGVRMELTDMIAHAGGKEVEEKNILFADSTFFRMFSFPVLQGDTATALNGPYKVLLTASTARKYFGNTNPIGQVVELGVNKEIYQVTGILADCPSNSQIPFNMVVSFSSNGQIQESTYWNANYTTYLLLKNNKLRNQLQAKIPGFMKKEMGQMNDPGAMLTYHLEPFNSIHLHSTYNGFVPGTSITYIYIIAAVALLLLCIACFTYINLSTARSAERSREVGIRKVSGAGKQQIVWQFLIESVILCLAALLISAGMIYLLMPAFNQLTGSQLQASALFTPSIIIYALSLVVVTGLLAGSYPAFILSAFQPVKVLKGFNPKTAGSWLRPTLIVFQFVISIVLIISTFVVQQQLHYIQNTNLGYNRDQIVVLPMDRQVRKSMSVLKTALLASPDVRSVSAATNAPTQIGGGYTAQTNEMQAKGGGLSVTGIIVDEDYLTTTGIKLVAGRNFTQAEAFDTNARMHLMLNETAVAALGWTPEQAINKPLYMNNDQPGRVQAVIKDFHFSTLHNPIGPLVFFNDVYRHTLLVKISGANVSQTIAHLQKVWKSQFRHRPFNYHFLDEDYNNMYQAELRTGRIVNTFSVIALVLACMGLLGLSSYTVYQRTKEIGIRKVLGATLTDITALLSKDFLKLVLIAIVTATPIAWYAMHKWLQQYVYRIHISWWVFALAGAGALVVTLLAVSSQTIKAGRQNPVKTLKAE